MRPLSEATARITGQSFNRKYIALGRIVKCWNEIVGEKLASRAVPVKINYRGKGKQTDKKEKPDAILDIAVSSAEATALHYQKDLILERINQIFGERWITDIRFVNISTDTPAQKQRKSKTPLTAQEKTTLSTMVESVEDPEIKARLLNLGQEIMRENKS